MKLTQVVIGMAIGLALLLPQDADAFKNACGSFQVVKGDVQYLERKSSKKMKKARRGKRICSGGTIQTGKNGRAKVRMPTNKTDFLHISPNSKVVVKDLKKGKKEEKRVLIDVIYGKLRANLKKDSFDNTKKNQFRVKTKSAVAGVRGTQFLTNQPPGGGNSEFVTFQGQVEVGEPVGSGFDFKNPVTVGAGQKTSVAPNQPPKPPVEVPAGEMQQLQQETMADQGPQQGTADNSQPNNRKQPDKKDPEKREPAGDNQGDQAGGDDKKGVQVGNTEKKGPQAGNGEKKGPQAGNGNRRGPRGPRAGGPAAGPGGAAGGTGTGGVAGEPSDGNSGPIAGEPEFKEPSGGDREPVKIDPANEPVRQPAADNTQPPQPMPMEPVRPMEPPTAGDGNFDPCASGMCDVKDPCEINPVACSDVAVQDPCEINPIACAGNVVPDIGEVPDCEFCNETIENGNTNLIIDVIFQ